MRELLLIDLAMCAAVIVVTAAVIVMHRRRGRDQPAMPVEERRGAVATADERMSEREVADVPGLSHEPTERGPGTNAPADPELVAQSQVSGVAEPDGGSHGPGAELDEPRAAGAVTMSERIGSYYEEADRPVADYLAASGWTEERGAPCRAADAHAAPALEEATTELGAA